MTETPKDVPPGEIACLRCGRMLKITDKYCSACGESQYEESFPELLKMFLSGILRFRRDMIRKKAEKK